MQRWKVFSIINTEREYQESTWPRDERRREFYSNSGPHILMLQSYITQAIDEWRKSGPDKPATRTLAKIATIAVRALEEIETAESDLKDGLR